MVDDGDIFLEVNEAGRKRSQDACSLADASGIFSSTPLGKPSRASIQDVVKVAGDVAPWA
jgi:hypothetical protein